MARSYSFRDHRGTAAFGKERKCFSCPHSADTVSEVLHKIRVVHTVSLIRVQISADPALVTGITLINLARGTSATEVDVKSASRLTFHLVVSHVKDCSVNIEPAHTKVHSEPAMYLLYLSSER